MQFSQELRCYLVFKGSSILQELRELRNKVQNKNKTWMSKFSRLSNIDI